MSNNHHPGNGRDGAFPPLKSVLRGKRKPVNGHASQADVRGSDGKVFAFRGVNLHRHFQSAAEVILLALAEKSQFWILLLSLFPHLLELATQSATGDSQLF